MRTTPPSRRPGAPKPEPRITSLFTNPEAEQSSLGAMLMEKEAIGKAMLCLHPTHFYHANHGQIYTALAKQYRRSQIQDCDIDLITTVTELRLMGKLADVGGAAYLTALIEVCPSTRSIGTYAQAVIEAAQYRALSAGTEFIRIAARTEDGQDMGCGSTDPNPVRMYAPSKLTGALRYLADRIELMGEAKPAPDVKKFLAEGK